MRVFRKRKLEVEEVQEPTDPILPCGVEKIETTDNQTYLIDKVKIFHAIEGRMIRGHRVDPETGRTSQDVIVASMNKVVRHVAMGWRNSDRSFHELTDVSPDSHNR